MDRLGLCSLASHLSCCLQTSLRRLCDLSAKPLLGRSCPTVVTFNDADTNHGACLMDPNILLTLPHHHLPRYHHSHWTRKETEAGLEWGIGLPSCMACGWPRRRGLSPDLAAAHLHRGASPVAQWQRSRLQCGRRGFHPWVGKIP